MPRREAQRIHGHFTRFAGKFNLDRATKGGSVEWTVDTTSVNSGDPDKGSRPKSRDDHLRSVDFFNSAEFPKIIFKSTNVVFNGDSPTTLEGQLTMLGVTKPVTFAVEHFKCNPPSATGKERCGGHVVGKIKRSDFGMSTAFRAWAMRSGSRSHSKPAKNREHMR